MTVDFSTDFSVQIPKLTQFSSYLSQNITEKIASFPTDVRRELNTVSLPDSRFSLNLALWQLFRTLPNSQKSTKKLGSDDKANTALLVLGVLTLAIQLDALNDYATNKAANKKARQFAQQYVMLWAESQLENLITTDTSSLLLKLTAGQLHRLTLNFNLNEHINDYLDDISNRNAQLSMLYCQVAAALSHADATVIELSGQIGRNIGMAHIIQTENAALTTQGITLTSTLLRQGTFNLATLFAFQEAHDFFSELFTQKQKPTTEQFETAHKKIVSIGIPAAKDMADQLLDQAKLDVVMLPDLTCQKALLKLISGEQIY